MMSTLLSPERTTRPGGSPVVVFSEQSRHDLVLHTVSESRLFAVFLGAGGDSSGCGLVVG